MGTILWCYMRNSAFKKDKDYHLSADLTGQAKSPGRDHRGPTSSSKSLRRTMAGISP